MTRKEDSFAVSLLAFAIAFGLILVRGLCLSLVWGWFIVPLGVAAIGKAQALGIGCLIGLFWQKAKNKGEETEEVHELLWQALMEIGVAMLVAWICHWLMVRP